MNLREKQKRRSRARILKAASELFRKQGLQATGIDQIMSRARLTAGAFYHHFATKEDLIEAVLWETLPQSQVWPTRLFLENYLSSWHRDHPESGCPLATLGSDLGRARPAVKARLSAKLKQLIEERAGTNPGAKRKALKTLSLAVGALILARMTASTELSDEFLNCGE